MPHVGAARRPCCLEQRGIQETGLARGCPSVRGLGWLGQGVREHSCHSGLAAAEGGVGRA